MLFHCLIGLIRFDFCVALHVVDVFVLRAFAMCCFTLKRCSSLLSFKLLGVALIYVALIVFAMLYCVWSTEVQPTYNRNTTDVQQRYNSSITEVQQARNRVLHVFAMLALRHVTML